MSSHEVRRRTPFAAAWTAGLVGLALALSASGPVAAAGTAGPPVVAPYLDLAGPHKGNLDAAVRAGVHSLTAAFVLGREVARRPLSPYARSPCT